MAANLDQILDAVETAAPGVRIVGHDLPQPVRVRAAVRPGLAAFAQQVVLALNATLVNVYAAHGVAVADVAGAFAVADLAASRPNRGRLDLVLPSGPLRQRAPQRRRLRGHR